MSELPARWVSVDPGESTGYSVLEGNALVYSGTAELWQFVYAAGAALGTANLVQDNELLRRLQGEAWAVEQTDLAYLAGLLDGEGWIGTDAQNHTRIQVNMTVKAPLEWAHKTFGGKLYGPYACRAEHLPLWSWRVQTQADAYRVLRLVRPLLRVKGADADAALEALKAKPRFRPPKPPWEHLVMEDWSLYPDKALALSWDKQSTVRGIGALQFIAQALDRPWTLQPAAIKGAALAAGAEDLFLRPLHPNRHANDSCLHAVYYAAMQGQALVDRRAESEFQD